MRAFIDNLLKQLKEFFERLSKKERTRLILLVVVVIVLAIVVVALLGRTSYATLYSGLGAADAGDIVASLEEMQIEYKLDGTGTIRVPEKMVDELRVKLAAEGYLTDDFDLSILANSSGFGITESVQKEYSEIQKGYNIRKQILDFGKIERCSVIVNLAKDSPFLQAQNTSEASASVQITVKGNARLSNAEANAIAEIVRTAVPGIKYENISITDKMMNVYRVGDESEELGGDVTSFYALENQLRQECEDQITHLLTPGYGSGNFRVSAHVKLNFDKQVTESVEFEPPIAGEMDGIVRSAEELYENQRQAGAEGGVPGTDTNGMGATEYPYGTLGDEDEYRKALITKNYEINETRTRIERALGTIEDMSISVLIDSEVAVDDRSADIVNLVSKALGISEDYIAVVHMPFVEHGESVEDLIAAQEAIARQMRMKELLEIAIMWAVILLLGLAFMSIIRVIVKNMMSKQAMAVAGGGIDYLVDDEEDDTMSYEDLELNAKPEGVEQLEKFIEKDSRAVAQLLRNWLSDE